MKGTRGKGKKQPSAATLQRRADKGHRFRDIERSWTHFVWVLITGGQTMLLGVFSIIAAIGDVAVPPGILITLFCLTVGEFLMLYWISWWRRNIDADRAAHFERSVRASELNMEYDNRSADDKYECDDRCWRGFAGGLEVIALIIFLFTAYLLLRTLSLTTA